MPYPIALDIMLLSDSGVYKRGAALLLLAPPELGGAGAAVIDG